VKTIQLPAKSQNLTAFAERWVRSIKQECLSKVILFGEDALSRLLTEYSRQLSPRKKPSGKRQWAALPGRAPERTSIQPQHQSVVSDWAACSNTTSSSHEYFHQAGASSTKLPHASAQPTKSARRKSKRRRLAEMISQTPVVQ